MTLKVALDALAADAALWDDVARTLGSASSATQQMVLSEAQMSFASRDSGLQATYEEVRLKVGRLLDEGSAELSAVSTALLQVRSTYESTDEGASATLEGTWDPRT